MNYEYSILIAVFSFVWCCILTEPNMLLNPIYKVLDSTFHSGCKQGIEKHWLFKILIHCEKCNSGQIALWFFLYNNWIGYVFYPIETLFAHAAFISFTIFSVTVIKNTYTKYINNE